MNDRYLFRGRRNDESDLHLSDNNIWVSGSLIATNPHYKLIENFRGHKFQVNPATIGQCTGSKDKNDVLIFEGDVIKYNGCGVSETAHIGYNQDICSFIAYVFVGHDCIEYVLNNCFVHEVIGNIHDNPELKEVVCRDKQI